MKTYNNLYTNLCSIENLFLAYKNARKGKSSKYYIKRFEKKKIRNIFLLKKELEYLTYKPKQLKRFIIKDPKTRTIHISDFRDRVVHHALINILQPIYEKIFIYDSYANRINKGTHKSIQRFNSFKRKVSKNGRLIKNPYNKNSIIGYVLKADIKQYFNEVNQEILIKIINKKIKDKNIIWLTKQILDNFNSNGNGKGMPLGNYTSQFFANVYLNDLNYFIKHELKAKYYIRYVDDFVIIHSSKKQLLKWKEEIIQFLKEKLKLEIHPDKSKIVPLLRGIDFVGFRNFYYYKLLRKRDIRKIINKIRNYKKGNIIEEKMLEIFQGWNAYAKWANSYKLRNKINKFFKQP